MTPNSEDAEAVEQLLETPDLATALESEQFKKFLDQVPIAIAVADLSTTERVVYANPEFEKLSNVKADRLTFSIVWPVATSRLDLLRPRPRSFWAMLAKPNCW